MRAASACWQNMPRPTWGSEQARRPTISLLRRLLRPIGLSLDLTRETVACDFASGRHRGRDASSDDAEPFDADPVDVIDTYGADAVRWFALSSSSPDRKVIWSDSGLRGAWRFVQRLWRLINAAKKFSQAAPTAWPATFAAPALQMRRAAQRALAQVSGSIDTARLNVGVAQIHAFARALEAVVADASEPAGPDLKFAAREAAEMLVQLVHPMMPHLAEECWTALGHEHLLATCSWPAPEAGLPADGVVRLSVHVNGRKRADVTVARNARNSDIEASVLALDAVRRALDGKAPRKVVIVPQRIINVVA